ncbi:hypothetical protein LIER_12385 [Lithospermum erythrorhizon]|uniref:Uncharacterized protein n=1 Tax=Lithospermum erythrorhizon TaxID=34254 RepID=A0AAV3PTD7_LITER
MEKVEPSRWFKLWFLAKGGFGSEVRHHWSLSTSTLSTEDSTKTQTKVEKLRTGFPHALPHEVFCDEDVLIKAGLTKGVCKFPNTTLLDLLSMKHSSWSCFMPHKFSYKVVTTGKDLLARISKRKSVAASDNTSDALSLAPIPKKSRRTAKKAIPKDAPVITEVLLETLNLPSLDLSLVTTITIPDHIPSLDIMASAQKSPPPAPPSKASSSSGSVSLGYPYSLPSDIIVIEKTISKREEPTASLLLKNCILKGDMEGIIGYSSPLELHDAFSHFQLDSEESRAAFEADKASLEKRLFEIIRERDEARAQATDLKNKHADFQAVCNGLVKSKVDLSSKHKIDTVVFKSSLEESERRSWDLRAQLDSSQELLATSEKQLSMRPPPEVVIKKFKEGQNYKDLLINETV